MKPAFIGFDTSNYRTSVACVTLDGEILFNSRELLSVPQGSRGLRQEEAVFQHVRRLKKTAPALRDLPGVRIAAVCASVRPRDPDDSYMPVFEVGAAAGSLVAATERVPFYETTHQRGHLEAAMLHTGIDREQPMIALHLSGGTTELLRVSGNDVELIGGSLDLHAGQLVDRTGVAMGLPFPAGPALEELAEKGQANGRLGVSMEQGDLFCHFSGAEAAVFRWISNQALPEENIAREVFDFLARTVARMIAAGAEAAGARQVLLAGGIASSALFRKLLSGRIRNSGSSLRLIYGDPELCGDNAAGVALIGRNCYLREYSLKEGT